MADTTRNIWSDDGARTAPKPKKDRHPIRNFFLFLTVLLLVLAVTVVSAYRDGTGFDALRRYFNYGSAEQSGGDTVYRYDADSGNRFASLGNRLVILSPTSLRLLGADGSEIWSSPVKMSAPALVQGGDRVVAYDIGGRQLYLLDEAGLLLSLTAEDDEPYISATLNENGVLSITSGMAGKKGRVTVYNEELKQIFDFYSSRRFVMDAHVTDDGKYLAAVTLGQEDSTFVSNVVLYDLTKAGAAEPVANYDVKDGLVAAIDDHSGVLTTVSDTCLTFADPLKGVQATYSYADEFLREYDLAGDDFAALLLNRYQSGSIGRLVSVAPDGTELGSIAVNEEVRGLSACGRYLAVLYANALVIYTPELQVYASLRGTDTARDTLVRADGSALMLSSDSAKLFLP